MERVNLCVKINAVASDDPCALCGRRTDPQVGPKLFIEGTWERVCEDCGDEHAPELAAVSALNDLLEAGATVARMPAQSGAA